MAFTEYIYVLYKRHSIADFFPVLFLKPLLRSTIKFAPENQHCMLLLGHSMRCMRKKISKALWFIFSELPDISMHRTYSQLPLGGCTWCLLLFSVGAGDS